MIVEYDDDGRITHIISNPVPAGMEKILQANGSRYVVSDEGGILTHYVSNGAVTPRPETAATVSTYGSSILVEPELSDSLVSVVLEGEEIEIGVGTQHVEIDEAGPVTIFVRAPWPHIEGRYDVEVE